MQSEVIILLIAYFCYSREAQKVELAYKIWLTYGGHDPNLAPVRVFFFLFEFFLISIPLPTGEDFAGFGGQGRRFEHSPRD